MTDSQGWLSPEEVAARLRVSTETVVRWLRTGQLSGELGDDQAWRVAIADVDAYVQHSTPRPGTALLKRLEASSRPEESDKTGTDSRR